MWREEGVDIRKINVWHEKISEFSEFANKHSAEFEIKRLPGGKELLTVRLYYRPIKGEENGSKS